MPQQPRQVRVFLVCRYPKSDGMQEDGAYRCRCHWQRERRQSSPDTLRLQPLLPALKASPGINHAVRIFTFQVVPSGWFYFSQRVSSVCHNGVRGKDIALSLLKNKQTKKTPAHNHNWHPFCLISFTVASRGEFECPRKRSSERGGCLLPSWRKNEPDPGFSSLWKTAVCM